MSRFTRLGWALLIVAAPALAQPERSELEAGIAHENLDKGRADWESIYLYGSHKFAQRKVAYGGLRGTRRFDKDDAEALGGFYYPLGETWTGILEASVSPTHEILPKWTLFGQVEKQLGAGWGIHLGLRHSEFNDTGSNVGALTLERYFGNYRAAYSAYLGMPEGGGSAVTHRVALNRYYGDRNSVGISYITGKEVENVNSIGVVTTDVESVVLSGVHWFAPRWAVSFDLLVHEQGDLYTRQGVRLGLRHLF